MNLNHNANKHSLDASSFLQKKRKKMLNGIDRKCNQIQYLLSDVMENMKDKIRKSLFTGNFNYIKIMSNCKKIRFGQRVYSLQIFLSLSLI